MSFSRASFTGFASKGSLQDDAATFQDVTIPEALHPFIVLEHLTRNHVKIIPEEDLDECAPIGEGAFMKVHRGTLTTVDTKSWDSEDIPVAIKTIVRSSLPMRDHPQHAEQYQRYKEAMDTLLLEIDVTAHDPLCRHRNIVRLLGAFLDTNPDHTDSQGKTLVLPSLVMELALSDLSHFYERGDYRNMKVSPQELTLQLIADIADGISAIHAYGIVHADLKPENVLLFLDEKTEIVAKVGDFGLRGLGVRKELPGGGTTRWIAPEYLTECTDRSIAEYAPRDIYAFGLIVGYLGQEGWFPLRGESDEIRATKVNTSDTALLEIVNRTVGRFQSPIDRAIEQILSETVRVSPDNRTGSLEYVRALLFHEGHELRNIGNPVHGSEVIPFSSAQGQSVTDNTGEYLLPQFSMFPDEIKALIEKDTAVFPSNNRQNRARNLALAQIRGEDEQSLGFTAKTFRSKADLATLSSSHNADIEKKVPFITVWEQNKDHQIVRLLIENRLEEAREVLVSNPSLYNIDGDWTATHFAATTLRPQGITFIKLYHDLRLDIDVPAGAFHQTPLYLAVLKRNIDVINALLQLGANVNAHFLDDYFGDSDPDTPSGSTITALLMAAKYFSKSAGSDKIVRSLISAGASLEHRCDPYRETCLHLAARQGRDALEAILTSSDQAAAYINSKNSKEETPLKYAIDAQDFRAVKFLLENGAQTMIQGPGGVSKNLYNDALFALDPVHIGRLWSKLDMSHSGIISYEKNAEAICQLLLQHGAQKVESKYPKVLNGIDTRLAAKYIEDATHKMANGDPRTVAEDILQCAEGGEVKLTHGNVFAHDDGPIYKINIRQFPPLHQLHDDFMCKMRMCREPHMYMIAAPSTTPPSFVWRFPIHQRGKLYVVARIGRLQCAHCPTRIRARLHDLAEEQEAVDFWNRELDVTELCPKEDFIYEVNLGEILLGRPYHFILSLDLEDNSAGLLVEWIHIVRRTTEPLLNPPVEATGVSQSQDYLHLPPRSYPPAPSPYPTGDEPTTLLYTVKRARISGST